MCFFERTNSQRKCNRINEKHFGKVNFLIEFFENSFLSAYDKDYIETMKRLMGNNNGNLLFQVNFQPKSGAETKYSLIDKKSTK